MTLATGSSAREPPPLGDGGLAAGQLILQALEFRLEVLDVEHEILVGSRERGRIERVGVVLLGRLRGVGDVLGLTLILTRLDLVVDEYAGTDGEDVDEDDG